MNAPDRYAVIGNPIGHSRSPLIHSLFAQATGQHLSYVAIEGPLEGFAGAVRAFRDAGGRGMNVTLPFKVQAFELATEALEDARLAGAANALKFEGERIVATNFDGAGLVRDIEHNLGLPIAGRRVLLLGAGGATRGALVPIARQRPAALVVANRTPATAISLQRDMASHTAFEGCGFADLAGQRFDLVINATSAGLNGGELALPAGVLDGAALAYDMVYGKGLTPFLRQARAAGAQQLADGAGMLVEQAAEAFAWWRGVRPQTAPVIEQIRVPLA